MNRRLLTATALLAVGLAASGCSQIVAAIGAPVVERTPEAADVATTAPAFASAFTEDGSVSLASDVADDLEVVVDVWAADPKRTQEWTTSGDKTFGFAVNVSDYRVPEKAVLEQKRRVYLSQVSITSTLSPSQAPAAFQFTADPRTLVPADTLRSDRGLLLNSFQGGLLVPETVIGQLPAGTTGLTLDFALTLSAEGVADDDASFLAQTVHLTLPIEVFAD